MLHKLEEFTYFTLLGIRFWDSVLDAQVRNDLIVSANPEILPKMKSHAYRTKGDVYSFEHLYGLRDIEYGFSSKDTVSSPDTEKEYIVEVTDAAGRYINVAFPVGLPLSYSGVFLTDINVSPYLSAPKGVYLFPSINRTVPSWMAVIRGELIDKNSQLPASHALLRVSSDNGNVWYGIADEMGRVAVVFAYPLIALDFSVSPVKFDTGPLYQQTWDLNLQILYSPDFLETLSGTSIPNYMSILKQSGANIWSESETQNDMPLTSLPITLEFNKPVTLRTEKPQLTLIY